MKEPVIVHFENTSKEKVEKLNKQLPTDIHLVRYKKPTWKKKEKISAIRSYRMADIFDTLHDQGFQVLEIQSGFGTIRPNLFNTQCD